ncbi:MAG: DUF4175 family protein [Archangium sp.]
MFEPSAPSPGPAPEPTPLPKDSQSQGRALRLLREVRAAQARALLTTGLLLGVISFLVFLIAGAWVASVHPRPGFALIIGGAASILIFLVVFGLVLPRRRVGDDERTAKLLAARLPELNLDLLAAVELSRAIGKPGQDFSPDLARAFLRDVDARAAKLTVSKLIDQKPVQRASMALVATVFVVLALMVTQGKTLRAGLTAALTPAEKAEPTRRQPITGDIELTYRYPAHTALEPRVISGSTGDVSAPTGTEVTLKTRADRDVENAALIFGEGKDAKRVPLRVEKRELSGSFVINESGVFHVAFLDGNELVAEGPDQSITAEADQPPRARLTAPVDDLEIDPKKQAVTLKFEASDDYGLAALDLVFTPMGGAPQRISLKPDDGRTTRGSYQWDLSPLALTPGQIVTYSLEATDNDAVKGPKKGTSSVQRLKLYSSAEHRREALQKAEALWLRLIDHLADRMEGPDRESKTVDDAVTGKAADERGKVLADDILQLGHELNDDQDPPVELMSALINIGNELKTDVGQVKTTREFLLRITGRIAGTAGKTQFVDPRAGSYTQDLQRRLAITIVTDMRHSEKNVLYLEALLDRARLDAIRELAKQLREDRKELSRLLDEYKAAPDSEKQKQLLDQMQALKQRMLELQQRMLELSKNIRDDFMNAEALDEMQEEFGLQNKLDDVEKLIREGKTDEALKKMQELSMDMDDFLDSLDKASDKADEQMDPELVKQFNDFNDNLDDAIKKQDALSEKTRALRDKYRQQQKERIAKQGEALKKELKDKLDELEKNWQQFDSTPYRNTDEKLRDAQAARNAVEQALDANDFDLASEAADQMENAAQQMQSNFESDRYVAEQLGSRDPRQIRQDADRLSRDTKKAEEVARKLRDLFPQSGQQMSDQDRQQMNEYARQQRQLQQQGQQLQEQMDSLNERAPLFNEEAQQQMQQAGQRMQGAGDRLQSKDANRGYGEQQGALQSLRGLQQSMGESGKGKGKGMPMPLRQRFGGRRNSNEKVEIQDEDPAAGQREFRKDVMDAMKQGQPDRYKEQNKKYYEELVK